MGSVEFVDPVTGQDVVWSRDKENLFYKNTADFLEFEQAGYTLFSNCVERIPTWGYLAPGQCSLNVLPVLKIQLHPAARCEFIFSHTYMLARDLDDQPGRLALNSDWILRFGYRVMEYTMSEDIELSIWNYYASVRKDEIAFNLFPAEPDREGKDEELFRLIKLAFLWRSWQHRRLKWVARAAETIECGIYGDMKEANLRKICKRAGFATDCF